MSQHECVYYFAVAPKPICTFSLQCNCKIRIYYYPHWINVVHLHERESRKLSEYIPVCTQNHTVKAVPTSLLVWVLKMALAEKAQ